VIIPSLKSLQLKIVNEMNKAFGQDVYRVKKARKHIHVCCLKDCLFLVWFVQDADGVKFRKVISQHHSVLAHSNAKKWLFD
jgi:uncharacterized protein (DUF697 family)